jgi:GH25 family lysozyme M1 (1,4-beta-N-acetylmuramidase)
MLLEDGEYESFSPWSNPGMYTEDLESETEDEAAKAGRDDAYEEEEGLVDEGPSAEATQEVTDRYEFGDEREFEAEDAERAALADPEFGGQFEGEVDASRIEPGYADRWSELELPASVFPQPEEEEESPSGLEPGLSPLAQRGRLHPGKGARTPPWSEHVYGLVVHTTGGTLPGKARKAGVPPDEYAARYYLSSGGTHYVNGWAGADGQQLHQVMNERQQAWGVGRWKDQPATDQWRSIDSGRFELDLPPTVLRLWRARWPGFKDSLSLLPVRSSANLTYVHVECVPCVYYRNGDGPLITDPGATPMRDGLRFTRAQHETVARLALDIAQRHQWRRQETWWRTPRLLGHEDITPLSRHDKNGGWDPGGLRERPYFDWNFVSDYLGRLRDGTARPPSASSTTDAAVPTSVGGLLGALADRFRRLVQAGQEVLAITEAVRNGQTDVNQLANLVFFARHPELNGRPIRPEERQLAQEWLEIRDAVVRPVVARLAVARPARRPITAAPPKAPSVGGPAVSGRGPSAGKIYFGLDTASVAGNKDPDWRQAKSEVPIDFAIIRSNYGVRQDAVFTRDWPKIKSAGIVRGAYLFLRFPHNKRGPAPDPVAQAEALVKTVGNLDESDLPPTLDVEFPGSWRETKMTQRQLLAGVRDAWKVLKNHYGVAPIIYTSARVWRDDLGNPPAPDLVESPLWLARYPFKRGPAVHDAKAFVGGKHDPPVPPPWGDATNWWIHQYQGDAVGLPSFPTGNIDMNRFNTMVKGATGDRVKWAQRRLGISQTGQFDAELETALRAFQEKRGLPVDSVIDPRAFAYLCWSNP